MKKRPAQKLTLEYWRDGRWLVGRLCEVPGVLSQGKTLRELEGNILDAYQLMVKDRPLPHPHAKAKPIAIPA